MSSKIFELTEEELDKVYNAQRAEIETKIRLAEIVDMIDRLTVQKDEAILAARKATEIKKSVSELLARSRGLKGRYIPDLHERCLVPVEDIFERREYTERPATKDDSAKLERRCGTAVSVTAIEEPEEEIENA